MKNLREIISTNLINLRKQNNLTQIELAKQINFSDKAISRWEKGECLPDIETIEKLSEVFNVPMSAILESQDGGHKVVSTKPTKQEVLSQIFLICELWVILSVIYAYVNVAKDKNMWQIFVWGVPATAFVVFFQNKKNHNNIIGFVSATVFIWTFITSLFLHLIESSPWYFYILGVPMQGMLIVRYIFNYKQKSIIKEKLKKTE